MEDNKFQTPDGAIHARPRDWQQQLQLQQQAADRELAESIRLTGLPLRGAKRVPLYPPVGAKSRRVELKPVAPKSDEFQGAGI
jgi:hypothetical protein